MPASKSVLCLAGAHKGRSVAVAPVHTERPGDRHLQTASPPPPRVRIAALLTPLWRCTQAAIRTELLNCVREEKERTITKKARRSPGIGWAMRMPCCTLAVASLASRRYHPGCLRLRHECASIRSQQR